MIVDQFDEMLAQSAGQPLVCPISLHPSSSAGRIASGGCAGRSSTSWPPRPRLADAPARHLRARRVAAGRHRARLAGASRLLMNLPHIAIGGFAAFAGFVLARRWAPAAGARR